MRCSPLVACAAAWAVIGSAVAAGAVPALEPGFEANLGQLDAGVRFVARGRFDVAFVTPAGVVLSLPAADRPGRRAALRLGLGGAKGDATCTGADELAGRATYRLGRDASRWRSGVPRYRRVECRGAAPGVDVVFHWREGRLEYDLVLAPGADPAALRVAVDGADTLAVAEDGSLLLRGAFGELRQPPPVAYQERAGQRVLVAARWTAEAPTRARVAVAAYDRATPLVVDPVLEYASYLGGSAADGSFSFAPPGRVSVALDGQRRIYVSGTTASLDFPGAAGLQPANAGGQDVFLATLAPDGSALLHTTYLGGSGNDAPGGLAVDAAGNATVVGTTTSLDFPLRNALQPAPGGGPEDAFVARIDPSGTALVFSTYLGGHAYDEAHAVALDAAGNAFVAGATNSADFPVANAFQPARSGSVDCGAFPVGDPNQICADAFVVKLRADGAALLYATYLGGTSADSAEAIAVDSTGAATVVGWARSLDFPVANAFQPTNHSGLFLCYSQWNDQPCEDAFVTKLAPSGGALVYSTYLGGIGDEIANGVALHPSGATFVTGSATSPDFPLKNAAQPTLGFAPDAFVVALAPGGTSLLYSTFLGGNSNDSGNAIAVDRVGTATVVGGTFSSDFPVTPDAAASGPGGLLDAFVTRLPISGAIASSTRFGGSNREQALAVAVDAGATVTVAGSTQSSDLPTVAALQGALAGTDDAFLARLAPRPGEHICQVASEKAVYGNGDTVRLSKLRFANTGPVPLPFWIRLSLLPPVGAALTAASAGADGSIYFAAGFDHDLGPVTLFPISASFPRGAWAFRCEVLDPASGAPRASSQASFSVQ